jgi:uncharacterized metal-binding protein
VAAVRARPCFTVDGCAKLCSYKNVSLAGGRIARSVRVVDAFRDHKGAQPGDATALTPDGWTITESLAADVCDSVATCDPSAAAQAPPGVGGRDPRPETRDPAPAADPTWIGIIACAGEDLTEGTISRLAVRKVMEELRPDPAVTVCLPLYLAGDAGEQEFARTYPTITIDGCEKQCARCGREHSARRRTGSDRHPQRASAQRRLLRLPPPPPTAPPLTSSPAASPRPWTVSPISSPVLPVVGKWLAA